MRLLSTVLVATLGVAPFAAAAESWVEVASPNFTVVSNAGERAARRTATEFEQVRSAYEKVWPWARLAQRRPVVILALENERSLRRWAPAYFEVKGGIDVVSGTVYGAASVYQLVRTDSRPRDSTVTPNYNLYRAYVRLLLSSTFERDLPVWLANGLGLVLGNTRVRDDEIALGQVVPWEIRHFNEHPRLPLRTILEAEANSPLLEMDVERDQFDAQSYVLVHYLLFADGSAHAEELARFQQLWQAGRTHDEALTEAFGNLAALEAALPAYANRKVLTYARLRADARVLGEHPARILSSAEVAGLRARVHVAMDRPVEAQAAIEEGRGLDALSAASYDAEGLLADRDSDDSRATKAYNRAVALGSTSAHSHYRAAQLTWKPRLDAPTLLVIQKHLENAIRLREPCGDAHAFLAEVLTDQGKGAEAVASAKRAVELEPRGFYHRMALARALSEVGRSDEAKKVAEVAQRLARKAEDRSRAQDFITFLDESRQQSGGDDPGTACRAGDTVSCARILPNLEGSCDAGDAGACQFLAWLHSQGLGVTKDGAKAAGYVRRACEAGDADACVEQAWDLALGNGVPKDEPQAMERLETLCMRHLPACTRLAYIHLASTTAGGRRRAKALLVRPCAEGDKEACRLAEELQ